MNDPAENRRERNLSSAGNWLTTGRFAMFLAVVIVLAFPQVVTGFHSFVFRDYGLFGYPLAHYHRTSFWRGELPLWNPYNNCGLPFLAQWNTMVLYPPSLIYLLMPLPWSLSMFTLVHQFFAGLGMYVLASRWTGNRLAGGIAGIAFAFNGFTLNCLMWPNHIASLAWVPWVILTVHRAWQEGGRRIWQAALIGALQMLSGTPEIILFTWLILFVLWLSNALTTWKQAWTIAWRVGIVVLLVSALSAAQLLPFLELVAHSERNAQYEAGHWPIPLWGWANLFVPLFRTFPTGAGVYFQSGQLLTSSYYPGLFVMLLAILAMFRLRDRRIWLLGFLIVISVVTGMGERAYLYAWLRDTFPQFGMMRYLVKFVIVLAIVWPLLAAFGFVAIFNPVVSLNMSERTLRLAMALGATIIAVVAGVIVYARLVPYRDDNWILTLQNGCARVAFLLATLGITWKLSRAGESKPAWLLQAFLLMVISVDLMKHVPQQNPTVPRETMTMKTPFLDQMNPRPQIGDSRAFLSPDAHTAFAYAATSNLTQAYLCLRVGLYNNANLIDGIPKVDGFYALYLQSERDVYWRIYGLDHQRRQGLERFLGVSQVTSATNVLVWSARTNYMPILTAGQMPTFANRDATLAGLISTAFTPEKVVYLPEAAARELVVTNRGGARVLSSHVSAHRIEADVDSSTPSIVVIAQAYYQRWAAFVDAQPTKLWRANHAFQALQVPAGRHTVRLVYQDRAFTVGAMLSIVTLVGIGFAWIVSKIGASGALIRDKPEQERESADAIATLVRHEKR